MLKKSSHFITFYILESPKQISKTFIFHILWVIFHFPCCTKLFLLPKTLVATTIPLQLCSSIAQNCFCYLKLKNYATIPLQLHCTKLFTFDIFSLLHYWNIRCHTNFFQPSKLTNTNWTDWVNIFPGLTFMWRTTSELRDVKSFTRSKIPDLNFTPRKARK